jgi:hypothetical protein
MHDCQGQFKGTAVQSRSVSVPMCNSVGCWAVHTFAHTLYWEGWVLQAPHTTLCTLTRLPLSYKPCVPAVRQHMHIRTPSDCLCHLVPPPSHTHALTPSCDADRSHPSRPPFRSPSHRTPHRTFHRTF